MHCDLWCFSVFELRFVSEVHIAKRNMYNLWIETLSAQAPGPCCRLGWRSSNRCLSLLALNFSTQNTHACSFRDGRGGCRQIEAVSPDGGPWKPPFPPFLWMHGWDDCVSLDSSSTSSSWCQAQVIPESFQGFKSLWSGMSGFFLAATSSDR